MDKTTGKRLGKRLSFIGLFRDKEYTVEIPIIQRDYAQGRDAQKEMQIRDSFLNTLESCLANNKHIDLDFVYGSLAENDGKLMTFVPLDGQQRLTTLFLLHWYLANKGDNYEEFKQYLTSNGRSKFSYKTRTSSTDFCDSLVVRSIDFKVLSADGAGGILPSAMIKDSAWYFNAWDYDPTVKSMLRMIDAIHFKFGASQGYYARLISFENPLVTFQFMNLEEFKLTDDLYIKMNARGKMLTDFEIFKAWLQGYIEKKGWAFPKRDGREWQYRIDQEWTDLFWQHAIKKQKGNDGKEKDIDSPMLNLFRSIGMYELARTMKIQAGDLTASDKIKIVRLNENMEIGTLEYEKWSCFSSDALGNCFRVLDHFSQEAAQRDKLNGFVENRNYTERITAYAYLLYIVEMPEKDCVSTSRNFTRWIRMAGNIVRNTIIDEPVDFVRAVQSLRKLWDKVRLSRDGAEEWVLNAFATMEPKDISFFRPEQIEEERKKADLIQRDADWDKRLQVGEDHPYFYGQIGFLLKFAEKDGGYDKSLYDMYLSKASQLYDDAILNHKDHLLERALLTKGDYLVYIDSSYSCCKPDYGTLRLREENWRRVFRSENQALLLKQLIDDVDSAQVESSLRTLIQEAKGLDEWQQLIVECPEAISLSPSRRIVFTTNGQVYPMTKTRMSGYHYELRTLHLFYRVLQPRIAEFVPFTDAGYEPVPGSDRLPYAYFSGWKYGEAAIRLNIKYENKTYILKLYEQSGKALPESVQDAASGCGFAKQGSHCRKSVEPTSVHATITQLLSELRKLS